MSKTKCSVGKLAARGRILCLNQREMNALQPPPAPARRSRRLCPPLCPLRECVCVCMCANFDWCLTYSMKATGLFFQFLNIKSFYNDYTFPIAHLGDNHVIGISQLREGCRRYTDVKDKKWGKRTRFQPSRSSRWSVCGWPRNHRNGQGEEGPP